MSNLLQKFEQRLEEIPKELEALKVEYKTVKAQYNKLKKNINRGVIYIIKVADRPVYKIGKTDGSVAKRLKELQTGSPEILQEVFSKVVTDYGELEKYLHKKFSAFNVLNEWFELDEATLNETIEEIKQWKIN